jgi:hypothetical protein
LAPPSQPLQTVSVRVVLHNHGNDCLVKLDDYSTGQLFAAAPLERDPDMIQTCCEPTLDSSRYFVLRVVDITGEAQSADGSPAHAFLGLGFPDRTASSNFRAALDDFVRLLRREREAEEARKKREQQQQQERQRHAGSSDENVASSQSRGSNDFTLTPGQKITVSLPHKRSEQSSNSRSKQTSEGSVPPVPPPPPPSTQQQQQQCSASGSGWASFDDDSEFGGLQEG